MASEPVNGLKIMLIISWLGVRLVSYGHLKQNKQVDNTSRV